MSARRSPLRAFVAACHRTPKDQFVAIANGFDCSGLHPNAPARLVLARRPDSALVARQLGRLVVRMTDTFTHRGIGSALVYLDTARAVYARSDTSGTARTGPIAAGPYSARALAIGYHFWSGPVSIRAGFADTLFLGLGMNPICD